jgi:hypothetical protein
MNVDVSFAAHTIRLQSWETKGQMTDALAHCEAGSLVLGHDSGHAVEFCSAFLHLNVGSPGVHRFGVGLCSERHGLAPQLLLRPSSELVLFGFNSEVVGVSARERRMCFRVGLECLFHTLVALDQRPIILVIHEIGAAAISEDGRELWRHSKDLVTAWAIEANTLRLDFMDSPTVRIDVLTGSLVT